MLCRNWQGDLVESAPDLTTTVATYADRYLVWSRHHALHQIRYGLQVKQFYDSIKAATEFGMCVRHYAECEGRLHETQTNNTRDTQ
jgi:hypothetical protein